MHASARNSAARTRRDASIEHLLRYPMLQREWILVATCVCINIYIYMYNMFNFLWGERERKKKPKRS